jgi:hypothetical protein
LGEDTVKLAIGHNRNGLNYNIVQFGGKLTGFDEVEADKKGYKGIERICFLAGKQIAKLLSTNHPSSLDGPIGLELFTLLDMADILTIREGAEAYRNSFRRIRAAISAIRNVPDSISAKS